MLVCKSSVCLVSLVSDSKAQYIGCLGENKVPKASKVTNLFDDIVEKVRRVGGSIPYAPLD